MTPEEARRDLAKDAMKDAVRTIIHNGKLLEKIIDSWVDGQPPASIREHAGMILHVAEALAQVGIGEP